MRKKPQLNKHNKNISNELYKSIDKLLNHSLPDKIVELNIDLSVDRPTIITCKYCLDKAPLNESYVTEKFKVQKLEDNN